MANKDRFDNRGRPIQRNIPEWVFGEPTLFSQGNGTANWARAERTSVLPTDQKSTTGWLAKLYGGTQTGWDDAGSLYIPVNEMPLTKLSSAQWTYWMANTELFGCQIQIWVHDPTDNTKRGDIIQTGSAGLLSKSAGWNGHILNRDTGVQFFYYAENEGTPGLTEGSGNLYSLAQFQTDVVFSTWMIYRISFNNGFYNAGHFGDMYVADVKINGEVIQLKPTVEEQLEIMRDNATNALKTTSTWTFGQPTVFAHNNSKANWERGRWDVSTHQKGSTDYVVNLVGGLQTGGTSAAGASIPVNETPVSEFNTAKWSYFLDAAHAHGVNIVLWCHDKDVPSRRVEITQSGSSAGVGKASGQNTNIFPYTVSADMFYTGEIVGAGTPDTTPTSGTLYTWAQFQADSVFSAFTIFKITFEFGMLDDAVTFTSAYLEEVRLNGQAIRLAPEQGKFQKTVTKTKTLVGGANSAFDVLSESAGSGTDWDFEFGGQGKIIDAVMTIATTALTAETSLHCFGKAPTCVLNDNVANTSPVAADVPYFFGAIELPALRDYGTAGLSYTHASPSTPGGIPLRFNTDIVRAVLISVDAMTPGAVLCTISLTAEMEYN